MVLKNNRHWIIIAFLYMCVVFTTQNFSQPVGQQPDFQKDSDTLVVQKIYANLPIADEIAQLGGFLHYVDSVYSNSPGLSDEHQPYLSQVGLQGTITYLFYKIARSFMSADDYLALVRVLNAVILAVVLFMLVFRILSHYSTRFVAVAIGTILFFGWVTYFSTSLYWVHWTHYLPLLVAFLLYPRVQKGDTSRLVFYGAVGFAVFFKALSGYEYITNVIAAPTLAIVYYEWRAGTPYKAILTQSIILMVAGVVGFGFALAAHLLQGILHFGSFEGIWDHLSSRAMFRTFGDRNPACIQGNALDMGIEYMNLPIIKSFIFSPTYILPLLAAFLVGLAAFPEIGNRLARWTRNPFIKYALLLALLGFFSSNPIIDLTSYGGYNVWPIFGLIAANLALIALAFILDRQPARMDQEVGLQELRAIAAMTVWAFIISCLWLISAPGHMSCHITINNITFFIPFGVICACLLAASLAYWSKQREL